MLSNKPIPLSQNPTSVAPGSFQRLPPTPKGSPPGLGSLYGRLGRRVLGVHEWVRECLCDLFGEGSRVSVWSVFAQQTEASQRE